MSLAFNSNQYNDTFQPKRLRNWVYGINNPCLNPRRRCGVTVPTVDCNGHLLPHIKRDPSSSPWGNYRAWIWEEPSTKCDCVDRIRNPQNYDRGSCNIVVVRERPNHTHEAALTAQTVAKQLFLPAPDPEIQVVCKNIPENEENEETNTEIPETSSS